MEKVKGPDKLPGIDLPREEIFRRVKELKLVYTDKPQPELLIPLTNRYPGQAEVEHVTPEFTSLCPFSPGQPDSGVITIRFLPDQTKVELKSLKFYLASFRMVQIFHEDIVPLLVETLYNFMAPFYVDVLGQYSVRGGISTTVRGSRYRAGWNPATHNPYKK